MKRVLILFVLLLSAASVARADDLLFILSGVENGSFELASNPTSTNFGAGVYTEFSGLTFTDGATTQKDYQIIFFSTASGGAFATAANPFGFYGDQVYTGTENNPVFAPGVFPVNLGGPTLETLTIEVAPAPEPASLILMLTGFASTGFVAARRKWALRA